MQMQNSNVNVKGVLSSIFPQSKIRTEGESLKVNSKMMDRTTIYRLITELPAEATLSILRSGTGVVVVVN